MAVTQLAGQVVKETGSARYDSTIGQAQANEGLLAKWNAGTATDTQNGKGVVGLSTAPADKVAGVIQNVSGANLTSSPGPGLDPDGTAPGGTDCVFAKRGRVLVQFDTSTAPVVLRDVYAGASGFGTTPASAPASSTRIGVLVSAIIPTGDY